MTDQMQWENQQLENNIKMKAEDTPVLKVWKHLCLKFRDRPSNVLLLNLYMNANKNLFNWSSITLLLVGRWFLFKSFKNGIETHLNQSELDFSAALCPEATHPSYNEELERVNLLHSCHWLHVNYNPSVAKVMQFLLSFSNFVIYFGHFITNFNLAMF